MPEKDEKEEFRFLRRHFSIRELSWLRFNFRVLEESVRSTNPLLERLKFLSIVSNNLDEFFEVRVASLEQKFASDMAAAESERLSPGEILNRVYRLVDILLCRIYRSWNEDIRSNLAKEGYVIVNKEDFSAKQQDFADRYFHERLYPVLTPIKIDSSHPFPWVINKALCIAALLNQEDVEESDLGVVTIPRVLPRIIALPTEGKEKKSFTFITDIVEANMREIFSGYEILAAIPFRITRNSNLYLNEEEESNLLKAVEKELSNRRKGDVVRLEIRADAPRALSERLRTFFELRPEQTNLVNGPVNFNRVMALYKLIDRSDLKAPVFLPRDPDWDLEGGSIFSKIREKDQMLHHPYDSFKPVLRLLTQAAVDPKTLSIRITLYRTGEDSPIIKALQEAAANGKEVTVVLELRARFDEESNVAWARHLLDHGVHVVYGLLGRKTHCKLVMIVREEGDKLVKYMHIGTGNYNENTARLYTDISLFTAREEYADDVLRVFNALTSQSRKPKFSSIMAAPFNMTDRFLEMIENETHCAQMGKSAGIIFKLNSLLDHEIIAALYRASMAGVKIQGIVRGICSLKPGRRPYSANISIRSIVGNFLEHARIFHFSNTRPYDTFIGSADWMPRNLHRRVEVIVPIIDREIRDYIVNVILNVQLRDNIDARISGRRWSPPESEIELEQEGYFSCQREFKRLARLQED